MHYVSTNVNILWENLFLKHFFKMKKLIVVKESNSWIGLTYREYFETCKKAAKSFIKVNLKNKIP